MTELPSALYFFILLGVSEIGLALVKRSHTGKSDGGSLGLLWGVILTGIAMAIYVSYALPGFGYGFHMAGYALGAFVFFFGMVLRWWAIIHPGRFLTVNVAIAKDHHVVSDGPYRLVHHLSYTGALLAFVGLAISLHSWLEALLLLVPITAAFMWRIHIEEQVLSKALGPAYTDYMARTKKLVPFLF
ncbi:MAG: isoprenylcysteine carboxylmethyltransferase family protein [Flavobacteriales bacterium]|nr:isoprenylcysteine carboxylmethyltransferase family protein [Flavobacteriales bacterium]